jgi:hypothetical protein
MGPYSSTTACQSTLVMSPRFGTVGQCRARIFAAYWWVSSLPFLSGGSYWECQITSAS